MSALHKSENDSDSMKEGSLDIRNLSPDSAGYGAVSNHEKRPGSASDGGVPLSGQKQPYRGLELSGRPGFLLWKVFRLPGTKNSRLPVLRILAPAFLLLAYLASSIGVSLCIFYSLTGLPCPGCGMTRSVHFLIHGDLLHSLQYHPLGLISFLVCALATGTLFSRKLTRLYEEWEPKAMKLATPGLILILLFAAFRAAVIYSASVSGDSWGSEFSGLFASFDEPGFLDFLLSPSLFRIGSF